MHLHLPNRKQDRKIFHCDEMDLLKVDFNICLGSSEEDSKNRMDARIIIQFETINMCLTIDEFD